MSSSGLIYAVIVGAWAAYLVPMWLRRQDELNEARPTERFSTAIRLLAGRSAMERRVSRALGDDKRDDSREDDSRDGDSGDGDSRDDPRDDPREDRTSTGDDLSETDEVAPGVPDAAEASGAPTGQAEPADDGGQPSSRHADERTEERAEHRADQRAGAERRARLLARRRRMVTVLFLAFACGAVIAAVAGLAFLWVPALPAVLLTLYIGHLRKLERQRYEVKLDRSRAAQAAEQLRKRERRRTEERGAEEAGVDGRQGAHDGPAHQGGRADTPHNATHPADRGRPHLRLAADPTPQTAKASSALAEATDHEEWVDGMRERGAAGPDSWEPVPVPLPTYVTAPVAPRVTRGLDLGAPGTWTAGRPGEARNTPLYDQYAEPPAAGAEVHDDEYAHRPRAANE
ncbi:gephyrin-like molybdotransferase receptor GlpR [Kitasatospora sp. NPDC050543]|uniref:divisome protein SepX/GlpR n=1 Tax=Kitasatospora sp. NPDC050543 TaxID=3364054 RepID=UPI0037A0F5A1